MGNRVRRQGNAVHATGLGDHEHAFYLNVHDCDIEGNHFYDYYRSAVSLRFGGCTIAYNTVDVSSKSYQGAFTYYEYDGAAYKTIEIHRNLVQGTNPTDTDMWIGTSEGGAVDANWQAFNVTDNCMNTPTAVKWDSALTPGPHVNASTNSSCSGDGTAYWPG